MTRDDELFADALGIPEAKRAAFLARACAGDTAQRARIEALLRALGRAPGILESPITQQLAVAPEERPSDTIGRYKLLEKIGEGGCGVVWLAEQSEPVRRRVALKVIKLGMDTKEVIARFEAERQALALMDHPNIAKIHDGGTTDKGRPYFVMELVKGIPITRYCDEQNLPTGQRLQLFIQVCHAIQHAHQKGIIHRDIKPSNILVTEGSEWHGHPARGAKDSQTMGRMPMPLPIPKVIDFGIAKATQGRLTDATVFTAFAQFIGTPAYMSPEQAELNALDVDTRSDIYSLGVLLYELLAGAPPFDPKSLAGAGLDEIRRTIREVEPPRPSTRISKLNVAEASRLSSVSSSRAGRPCHVTAAELAGDLDWIVMKALEKNRARRYESASAFAADVQRHLAHEPVVARPPSAAYSLQKLFRRHRLAFAAAAAIAATLVIGIAASTWQAVRATRAEREQNRLRETAQRAQAAETTLRQLAEAQELVARRRAYAADMNLAQQALDHDKLGRALELLNRHRPKRGETDLRGWEWRYLWQFCQSEAASVLGQLEIPARVLSFSADGKWFVARNKRAAESEEPFWLGSLQTGKARPIFAGEVVLAAAFSPKASLLAVGGLRAANVHQVRLVNPATKETIREWRLPSRCRDLFFSSDGETLLTITRGRVTQFVWWRVADGQQLARTEYAPQDYPFVSTWVVTPDLRLGAYRKDEAEIHLVDLRTGEERWAVQAANETLTTFAFSPDGTLLASTGSAGESDIRFWDVATGKETGRLAGHRTFVQSLLFWPDGKTLVSGGADQTIRLWDVASRRLLHTLRGHTQEVWSLALMPDQRTLASGSKDGAIFTWDIQRPPTAPAHVKLPRPLESWRFAADSQSILSVARTGDVVRWLGSTFSEAHVSMNVGDRGDAGDWSHHVVQEGALIASTQAGRVRIWDLEKRQLAREFGAEGRPVGFLGGGETLLLMRASWHGGSDGNGLHEWTVATGVKTRSWATSDPWGAVLHALPSGRQQCLMRCTDGTVSLINLHTGEQRTFQLDGRTGENCDVSPDGRLFAAPNRLGWIGVWETKTFQRVATLSGFAPGIYSAAFSPDGRRLAAGGDAGEAIRLWDVDGWEPVLTLATPGHAFESTSFSPDGNVLGSKTFVGELHLWRAPSWAEIAAAEVLAAQKP